MNETMTIFGVLPAIVLASGDHASGHDVHSGHGIHDTW